MFSWLCAKVYRLLPKNAFALGVSVLVGGTASAQILMILAAPFLTRLYTPADFGLLAVYVGLLSVIVVVASLRYELAIPLPVTDREAVGVLILSLLTVVFVSAICSAAIFFAGDFIAVAFGVPKLADMFWLLPVGILLQGFYKVFNYWAIRSKNFPVVARTRIWQSIVTLSIQLLAYKSGGIGLLIGQAGGPAAGTFGLARSALRRQELAGWRWRDVWLAAHRYRDFPIFSTWSALLNAIGSHFLPLVLAAAFSPVAAGLYALANRVLAVPMTVVGSAVANVFLANAPEAQRENRLPILVSGVYKKLMNIAMPPMVILLLVGPEIFSLVFGSEWQAAGSFAQWMAPWLFVVFITSPLSTLFEVLEKQKQHLMFQVVLLCSRVVAIMAGIYLNSIEVTVALFSIASTLCWGWFLLWVLRVTGTKIDDLWKKLVSALAWAFMCVLPLVIVKSLQTEESLLLAASLLVSGALICIRYLYVFRLLK